MGILWAHLGTVGCIGVIALLLCPPQTLHIWLGGLFTPEAYITATRQYVAQANNWSLEELYLDVHVGSGRQLGDCSFAVTGE